MKRLINKYNNISRFFTKKQVIKDSGFTILELLIATSIFTVILLLCTVGLVQIGRNYYKGTVLIRTQNVARESLDTLSQSIQYGGTDPTPLANPTTLVVASSDTGSFCVGDVHYVYNKYDRVIGATHGLQVRDGCTTGGAYRELLGQNMRLSYFEILKYNDFYTIRIKVTYGENDLMVTSGQGTPAYGNCNGGVGSQFCASSELQSTVRRKLK